MKLDLFKAERSTDLIFHSRLQSEVVVHEYFVTSDNRFKKKFYKDKGTDTEYRLCS